MAVSQAELRAILSIQAQGVQVLGQVEAALGRLGATSRTANASFGQMAGGLGAISSAALAIGGAFVGVQAISGIFSAAQDAVIGFNSQLQKSSITFTAFAGSVELSQQFLGQLKELAASSPFEFQDVLQGAQRFAGMGLSMENIIPIMKDVSVVAQAMGAGAAQINQINLAISQVVARGKVSAQEMNQLANAGIPAWQLLATAMNKTVGEVMKLAEASDVSAADFLNAFDKAAHDPKMLALGDAMNKSFDTAISNVHDRLQFFAADAGKPIFDMATNVANGLANILGTPVITGMAQAISAMVQGMISALDPLGAAFTDAFAKLQTGDLTGALQGILSSINGFATQMFGAGYTLVTTMASGMFSGLSAVVSAAAEIAATIAGFFIGNSPPPNGPLAQIEAGGQTLMQTYVGGMAGGLGALDNVTQGVADAFGNVNKEMSLVDGRAGLQVAAGNAAMLKLAGEDAAGVLHDLDGMLHEVERSSQGLKFAADDIKQSYEDQITPLQAAADAILSQNDLLNKQLDIADQLRDAELKKAELAAMGDPVQRAKLQTQIDANNEKLKEMRLTQSQADLERQIVEAKKGGKDTSGLQARLAELQIQKQNADLERQQAGLVDKTGLAQVKQQEAIQKASEDRRRTDEDIQKLQRQLAAAPLLAQVTALKQEEEARLKPIQAAVAGLERQRAVLQAERQDWQALKQDIAVANAEIEKAKKPGGGGGGGAGGAAGLGGGLAGLKITPQPIAAVSEAAQKAATDFGNKFKAGVDGWFQAHGGELMGGFAGAVIGGVAFGPLGALIGGMFGNALVKSLQDRFPDIGAMVQEKLGVAAFAVEAFGKILQGQDAYIIPFQQALASIVPAQFQGLISGAGTAVATLRDTFLTIVQVLQGQWSPGIDAASSGIDPFVRNVGMLTLALKDVATALGPPIQTALTWLATTGFPAAGAAAATMGKLIVGSTTTLNDLNTAATNKGIFTDLAAAWKSLGEAGQALGAIMKNDVGGGFSDAQTKQELYRGVLDGILQPVKNITQGFKDLAAALSAFSVFLKQNQQDIGEWAKAISLAGGPLAALAAILKAAGFDAGKSYTDGAVAGLQSGAPNVLAAADGVAGAVPQAFRDKWAMHSPSQVAIDQGLQYATGLAQGLSQGDSVVAEAVLAIVKNALANNIDPMIALALAKAESDFGRNPVGDHGHSVGIFQLHDQGQGAGMSVADRMDPWVSARKFLAAHAAEYQALVAEGLAGDQLAKTFGRIAEVSDPRYAERYAQAYRELVGTFGATGAAGMALTAATGQLGTAQVQATDWAKVFADQQAHLALIMQQQVPAGAITAAGSIKLLGSVLGPIERQVAGGAISADTLRFKLLDLARATGLATAPWERFNSGAIDVNGAMDDLINSTATLGPDFAAVAAYIKTAGSDSNTAALMWLQAALAAGKAQIATATTPAAAPVPPTTPASIATVGANWDEVKGKADAAGLSVKAYQDIVNALDAGKITEQTDALTATDDALNKLADDAHSFADWLDGHVFEFHAKFPDIPADFQSHSPPPLQKAFEGIGKAMLALNRIGGVSIPGLNGAHQRLTTGLPLRPALGFPGPRLSMASLPPSGGGAAPVYHVTVNVEGSVMSENNLVRAVRDGLIKHGRRSGGRILD